MIEPTTTADAVADSQQLTFRDDRTIVFPAGVDVTGGADLTTHTPIEAEIAAALATADTAPELAWARTHARFVTADIVDSEVTVAINFSCEPVPESVDQAVIDMQNLSSVSDGGDCYGFALFDSTGNLLRWATNGEA